MQPCAAAGTTERCCHATGNDSIVSCPERAARTRDRGGIDAIRI
jgi:hypothetical protein